MIMLIRSHSFSEIEKNNLLKYNNISNCKRNSISDIKLSTQSKINFKKNASFYMLVNDSITQPSYIGLNDTLSTCNICYNKYPKNVNKFCSYKCYKNSKKDKNGNYNILCRGCYTSFITKNLFTDYCTTECFTVERSKST